MNASEYSYLKTAIKALSATIAVIAPGTVAISELPDDVATFEANMAVIMGGIAVGLIRAGMNVYKHRKADGNPIPKLQKILND